MAVIALSETEDWFAARWAFRWLLEQAMLECREDVESSGVLRQAIALDGLHFQELDPTVAGRVWQAVSTAGEAAANGTGQPVQVEGRILDERSQGQYRAAALELTQLLARGHQ